MKIAREAAEVGIKSADKYLDELLLLILKRLMLQLNLHVHHQLQLIYFVLDIIQHYHIVAFFYLIHR